MQITFIYKKYIKNISYKNFSIYSSKLSSVRKQSINITFSFYKSYNGLNIDFGVGIIFFN